MRVGELVKVKSKDVQFYQLQERADEWMHRKICCLVQVHPSTKMRAREVNAMGGKIISLGNDFAIPEVTVRHKFVR